ncbi:helix-turn-helix domain-containing protein [Actinosynnema pretiosum subsp. pretiosum]|uniref:Helix-turn-helix domain-containing protein n=1 Tax=Actinosynnema pretiosum subsp. pretiosum TaxID=103721 RepID=A0AA45R3W6_9PSEU|nr:Transcriptional regulator, AraC family [Actinosynnema pretiosum subsp. pretiosum]QUF04174.1 helix-turn-helix domain-containing protein [Actinosynnema pretiosum subsp. pretiosum]
MRSFPVAPTRELRLDHHYLLCASTGSLRLEARGRAWLLPPARAALIGAGEPIRVSVPAPVTTASVLLHPGSTPPPPAPPAVFDLTPLARHLLAECGALPETAGPLDDYARPLFAALVAVTWRLAEHPAPVSVPVGRSAGLREALRLTGERLGAGVRFTDLAAEVGLAPRSLARRFAEETGTTWRAVLRRMRLLRAIEALAGDEPVTTIAHAVGYGSLSAFNAAFLDLTGRTPGEYRASFRG